MSENKAVANAPDADPFDLARFVDAQEASYTTALAEIRRGAKRTHWMWFIFPQLAGLGHSPMAQRYAISSIDEACAYLTHVILGPRYWECIGALQDLTTADAEAVLGSIDAMKLRSSLTLFHAASPSVSLLKAALDRWFDGKKDGVTLDRLQQQGDTGPV